MSDKDTAIPFTDPNLSLVTELLMSRHCAAKQVSRNTIDTRRVRIRTVQRTAGFLENNIRSKSQTSMNAVTHISGQERKRSNIYKFSTCQDNINHLINNE